jgi:hypothetical protein
MENLAIVIGVSKYINSKNHLPGCKNDAEAIYKILQRTDKFNSTLYINDDEVSAKTKERLTNFITESKGKQIDEIIFYYSGHGEFTNDEFLYLLSDYDTKKKNQTSLQNTEVDDLIRTLSPNLYVKIIDACQSGTTYIKENNVLVKYFDDTKKSFNKCYFLNSSLNNQASYQDRTISHFTLSFINALKEHPISDIRYKDIIDAILDDFSGNQEQTPFFVIQAGLTEKFCSFSSALREYLNAFDKDAMSTLGNKSKALSLIELVKQDSKDYVDKDGTIKARELIRNECTAFQLNGEMNELFKAQVDFYDNYQSIQSMRAITNWIKQNPREYFTALVEREYYDDDSGQDYTVTEFELKVDVPYKAISIDLINNYPNTLSYNCKIVFILSRKAIRFFYFITNYVEENWESKTLNVIDLKWTTIETKIADHSSIINGLKTMNDFFNQKIESDLKEKFKLEDPTEKKEETKE